MSNTRVAFIDDEPFWRDSVEELLEFEGYVVATFENPEPVLADPRYNIVIADGQLSDNEEGIDCLLKLHTDGFTGKLLLYTSLPRERDEVIANKAGIKVVRKSEIISDALAQIVA